VLIRELRERYLDPWCERAGQRLAHAAPPIARLPARFAGSLAGL
jgi:hypothetical protein